MVDLCDGAVGGLELNTQTVGIDPQFPGPITRAVFEGGGWMVEPPCTKSQPPRKLFYNIYNMMLRE